MHKNEAQLLAIAALTAGVALVVIPMVVGPYGLRVATTVFMFVALAQAWNLIGGYAGLMSLAHAAFFGTGAILTAIFLINGVSLGLSVAAAIGASVLIAVIVGIPTLRLRGHYFVVATLLATEAIRNLVINLNAFKFNGGIAVNIISHVGLSAYSADAYNRIFFYIMAGCALVSVAVSLCFEYSRWGLALRAVRDSERAASALGISAPNLKAGVFLLSAFLTAAVGSVWACWQGSVEANEAFSLALTFEVIVMVLLGGRGTVVGPIVGVILILLLNEWLGVRFAEISQIVSGAIVIVVVLFQPDGLAKVFRGGWATLSPKSLQQNLMRYRVR
ncbi:branched-chain amino acid ABC transporter permease [Bradyrhizobium sp. LjRoot220]|uniref:branched-chain amino acid ABC transporter permease n=1 Tax=Bradyrhizobium sp. LjRoot220 TaxID=3342284 RepID=UPI003ED1567A